MVSIIVPAYNAEKHLRECILSALLQTYVNLELVLVDDGSTDRTVEIAQHFASLDGRVNVVSIPNGGQARARNVGIDASHGQYIVFLDADDVLHEDFVKRMLEAIESTGADMVSCEFTDGEEPSWHIAYAHPRIFTPMRAIEDTLYQRSINCSACGKMMRRRLFNVERFEGGLWYEDLDLIPRLEFISNKVALLPQKLYFYRCTPGSFIHTFALNRLDVLKVVDRIESRFVSLKALRKAAIDRKFAANYNMMILCSQAQQSYAGQAAQCWQVVKDYRLRILLNPKSRLKNKAGALLSYLGKSITLKVARRMQKK